MGIKDIFVWQFWLGLIVGHFLLSRILGYISGKLASV